MYKKNTAPHQKKANYESGYNMCISTLVLYAHICTAKAIHYESKMYIN